MSETCNYCQEWRDDCNQLHDRTLELEEEKKKLNKRIDTLTTKAAAAEKVVNMVEYCNKKMSPYSDNWVLELATSLGYRKESGEDINHERS